MLNQKSLFAHDHSIYWPKKYEPVVKFLQNGTGEGTNPQSLYKLNVEVIVLAACVGLNAGYAIDVPSDKNEIALSTFNTQSLSIYLYIIPMLSDDEVNIDYFRNKEGEGKAISIFERFAAGGLELLNERLISRSLDSPYLFANDLLLMGDDNIRELNIEIF
jgi:hypothetical protein